MTTLTLLEVSALRLKLKELEQQLPVLSLFERCDVEDEILEIKEQLGEFERSVRDESGECINCSG